jgi:type IV pilus assembly protein PilW
MIGMTLGLVLITAALAMLLATSRTNRALDAVSRLQEAGRYALFNVERDVRMAGYNGCTRVARVNSLLVAPTNTAQRVLFDFELPFYGWRQAAIAGLPTGTLPASFTDNYARGDVLLIKQAAAPLTDDAAEPTAVRLNGTVERNAVNIPVTPELLPPFGQLLLLSNCTGGADLFQQASQGIAKVTTLSRTAPVVGLWPGNLTPASNLLSARYQPGSGELTRAESNLYYVGFRRAPDGSRSTETSLRRIRMGQPNLMPDEELVSGVHDLRVLFGLDTIQQGGTDDFRRPDALTSREQWQQIVALRLGIIAYSGAELDTDSADTAQQLLFDTTLWDFPESQLAHEPNTGVLLDPPRFVPPQPRVYRFFSSTVAARNRMH